MEALLAQAPKGLVWARVIFILFCCLIGAIIVVLLCTIFPL